MVDRGAPPFSRFRFGPNLTQKVIERSFAPVGWKADIERYVLASS